MRATMMLLGTMACVVGNPFDPPTPGSTETETEPPWSATQIGGEGTEDPGPRDALLVLPAPNAVDVPVDSVLFVSTRVPQYEVDTVLEANGASLSSSTSELLFLDSGTRRFVVRSPDTVLDANTQYLFDVSGAEVIPSSETFATGTGTAPAPGTIDIVSVTMGNYEVLDCIGERRPVDVELDVTVNGPSLVRIHADDGSCGDLDRDDPGSSGTTGDGVHGWISLQYAFVIDSSGAVAVSYADESGWGPETRCLCAVVMSQAGIDGTVSATVCAP